MTIQDAETDPDSQLLDRALPAIARQGASLTDEHEAARLALHSPNLLDALTNLGHTIAEESEQLDALDLIAPRRWAEEEFHSKIISWLLDPAAHHRQAGHFIASLLSSTMAPPRLLDADWSAAQVIQEWENVVEGQRGYLDILVLDQSHQSLMAIENKTFSQEHSNQLTRYRLALADAYPDFTRHHIFLSPGGASPNLERDRKDWQPATYSLIHDAIQEVLDTSVADSNANALLQIYATTIRRNVLPDTSIDQQARRIYLEHREAIDRISENKPKWVEETKPMLKETVAKHSFWELDCEDAQYVGFRARRMGRVSQHQDRHRLGPRFQRASPFRIPPGRRESLPRTRGFSRRPRQRRGPGRSLRCRQAKPNGIQTQLQFPHRRLDDSASGTGLHTQTSRLWVWLG